MCDFGINERFQCDQKTETFQVKITINKCIFTLFIYCDACPFVLLIVFFLVTHSCSNVWKMQQACTAELVSYTSTPSSGSFSSTSLLSFPLTLLHPLCAIFYIILILGPLPLCQFLHLPSSAKINSLLLCFSHPLSSLYDFPHPCQSFWVLLQRNIGGVWYMHVRGNMLTEENNRPFQGSSVSCSQRSRWEGARHSERAISQSLGNHGLRVRVQGRMCRYIQRVIACTWMPMCGFLDHMFMFNSLHICAGNKSSSPHRNDHSLSGLIKHILN